MSLEIVAGVTFSSRAILAWTPRPIPYRTSRSATFVLRWPARNVLRALYARRPAARRLTVSGSVGADQLIRTSDTSGDVDFWRLTRTEQTEAPGRPVNGLGTVRRPQWVGPESGAVWEPSRSAWWSVERYFRMARLSDTTQGPSRSGQVGLSRYNPRTVPWDIGTYGTHP